MFPPEIFTEIFSFLTSEARALVACSQAHPSFAQLVEPTLYAQVVIHDRDADDEDEHHLRFKPHQLTALLSDNPRILNYLHGLFVDLTRQCSNEVTEEIIAILGRLKLERIQLTFTATGANIAQGHWGSLPIAFRTAFVACISTSSMKEIFLDGIYGIPLSTFVDCAGLKRLRFHYYVVPPSNRLRSLKFPHLEALELLDWVMDSHSPNFFSSDACRLRSLTFTTSNTKVIHNFLPHVLAVCSTTLLNLSIYYILATYDAAPIEIDFPSLPNLERLHICTLTRAGSDKDPARRAVTTTTQILQKISSIKHLTLTICLQFKGEDITQDWSPLVDFLSDRRSSFQHTDLYIRAVKVGGEDSSDEIISMLSRYENLMNLVEAGCVSIKVEKRRDVHINRVSKGVWMS